VERYVDARQRNSREAAVKLDEPLLLLLGERLVDAAANDLTEHFANLLERELLSELWQV